MKNVGKKNYKPHLPDAFCENKKKSEKKYIYHILQTKHTINKDNENIYKAEKKINNNIPSHLVSIYKTYNQKQSSDIIIN